MRFYNFRAFICVKVKESLIDGLIENLICKTCSGWYRMKLYKKPNQYNVFWNQINWISCIFWWSSHFVAFLFINCVPLYKPLYLLFFETFSTENHKNYIPHKKIPLEIFADEKYIMFWKITSHMRRKGIRELVRKCHNTTACIWYET